MEFPPPLLASRPPNQQIVLGVVVPAVFGVVTGVLLGVTELGYLVLSLLGILGGYGAGLDHASAGEGMLRGFAGGLLFGTFILAGHALTGLERQAHLPEPELLLVGITTTAGVLLGALGGAHRARIERRAAAA